MKDDIRSETILAETPRATVQGARSLRKLILNPLVCSVGASVGIFGGISSLVTGVICIVLHAVVPNDAVFNRAGTTLLILGIPMLLAGSVFLDDLGNKERS